MKFSCNWIGQYVDVPEGAEALADKLTAAGLAVEGQEPFDDGSATGDVVFDIDITTNRVDAMNHLGLAREASVLTGQALRPPEVTIAEDATGAASVASVTIDEPARCQRFVGLVIRGVEVGPSPRWLVDRLEAIGSRSINNIVDVTNYVLWECGQPLHAYDLAKLEGAELRVRWAGEGETLVTLDGEKRALDPEILVIADARQPVGLAGVMGGLDSEVTASTVDILLEAAHFDPKTVRRGAKKLGMHTDASHRFERGADPEACLWAARRAAALMVELGGGVVLGGHLEDAHPRAEWPPSVEVSHGAFERFAGTSVSAEDVERMLSGLGFSLSEGAPAEGDTTWQVTPPSWRFYDFDDAYPADVYEEVLRIVGFDAVPMALPAIGAPDAPARPEHVLRRAVREHLAACGLAEAINYAFLDRARDALFPSLYGARAPLPLANPLSDRYAVMRRSLLPDLVESARYNQRRGASAVRLFEVGHIFAEGTPDEAADTPAAEQETVALVMGGTVGQPWEQPRPIDFFDVKGAVESLAEAVGVTLAFRSAAMPSLTAGTSAEILGTGTDGTEQVIGTIGELDDGDAVYPLVVAEIATAGLLSAEPDLETTSPPRLPGIEVDTTLTHALTDSYQALHDFVAGRQVADLVAFGLKDRYLGKGVPQGAVNTTLWFRYNAEDRSLTQDEVNASHGALTAALEARFGWQAE